MGIFASKALSFIYPVIGWLCLTFVVSQWTAGKAAQQWPRIKPKKETVYVVLILLSLILGLVSLIFKPYWLINGFTAIGLVTVITWFADDYRKALRRRRWMKAIYNFGGSIILIWTSFFLRIWR